MSKVIIIEKRPARKPKINWENITKIVGLVATLGTIIFSVVQYQETEKWKYAEFMINLYAKYKNNDSVKNAQQMLDYTKGSFITGKDTILYSDQLLVQSLRNDAVYDKKMTLIRKIFDNYFDELGNYYTYYKAGMIKFNELKPYLQYEIDLIADTTNVRKSKLTRKVIWEYINRWHFDSMIGLFKLYGYNIQTRQPADKTRNKITD